MNSLSLSSIQKQIVDHQNGALLVVAGPGSGKTRVLTERVRRLLTSTNHQRVLALTFTNKAAKEMEDRLGDLGDLKQKLFVGTLHGFCVQVLDERGKLIGVDSLPQIFENAGDRKQLLAQAVEEDPLLRHELAQAGNSKDRTKKLDDWMRAVSFYKAYPISKRNQDDPLGEKVVDAYDSALRACGAYDFDDLLLLTYRLFTEHPRVADFYRRVFGYICIDEAQDLNEAQYAVIQALCGDSFVNVMMVGDPRQSIYGFNTSSPEYMDYFARTFKALRVEMNDNYRSSRAVVAVAQALEPQYVIQGHLPIAGETAVLVGADEGAEAKIVVDKIVSLVSDGHPDIEGSVNYGACAILGRTRYTLLAVEAELKNRNIPFFRRLSSAHENESDVFEDLMLAFRLYANPRDKFHMAELARRWGLPLPVSDGATTANFISLLTTMSQVSTRPHARVLVDALLIIEQQSRLDLRPVFEAVVKYAGALDENIRKLIHDDAAVLLDEWDNYLRQTSVTNRSLAAFMSAMALGSTRQNNKDGVALLTVHSSKGLEFDIVFMVGMVDGVFPDFRSKGNPRSLAEEKRNAFVGVTRSRRLLFFSYPQTRKMPWGDVWQSNRSPYIYTV